MNIVIFGNSGAGKSTLALNMARRHNLAHLDLDTIAWLPSSVPERRPHEQSREHVEQFTHHNKYWVIEGCYSDLIELVIEKASEVIFLNLPVSMCIDNARERPWEPHKYASKKAQDANLDMLIDWIKQYEVRDDTFSQSAHQRLFDAFTGVKKEYTSNVPHAELANIVSPS